MSIKFSKIEEYETGETFFFRYEGVSPSVDVTTKSMERVKEFMNDVEHGNVYRDVVYLKTILKNLDEKLFILSYTDILGNHEEVKYKDKNLLSYKSRRLVDSMMIEIEKNATAEFSISFQNPEENFVEYGNSKVINKYLNDALLNVSSLKKPKIVDITEDAKRLIDIYKVFYGENPDFSDKDIRFNVHMMMNILENFGITLGEDKKYKYDVLFGEDMPIAMGIETIILTLQPLGKIVGNEKVDNLDYDEKRIIENVSKSFRMLSETDDIIKINKDFYIEKNSIDKNDTEVESSVNKVKSIKRLVNSRN